MTLAQYIALYGTNPLTLQGQIASQIIAQLAALGVPTSAWTSNVNTDLALTQIEADAISDSQLVIAAYVTGCYLDYATGEALTLFAKSQYQLDRMPSTPTIGKFRLTSATGAPTQTITAGQLTAGALGPQGQLYTNTQGGTLSSGGTLDLTFQALIPGTAGNIPVNSPLALRTVLPGVTVSNPAYASGTWITSPGLDEESDAKLKQRCRDRWSTLGAGGNLEAMEYYALQTPAGYTASPVTLVQVYSNRYGGILMGNASTVLVAGPAGALLPGDVAAVALNFENPKKYPLGTLLAVATTINLPVGVTGTVYIRRSANITTDQALGMLATGFATFQSEIPIGGFNGTLYKQSIEARCEQSLPDGSVRNVVLSAPVGDVSLTYDNSVIFSTAGLVCVLVDG